MKFMVCHKVRRIIRYDRTEELYSDLEMTSEEEDCDVMSYLVMRMLQKIEVFGRD